MPIYTNRTYLRRTTPGSRKLSRVQRTDVTNNIIPDSTPPSPIYDGDITNSSLDDYGELNSILDFSRKNVLSGIIFSEILGKPRARRGR